MLWSSYTACGGCSCLVWCLLALSVTDSEKVGKPGRAELFPFMSVNVNFVPAYRTHLCTLKPASEHFSLHLLLHLLCPGQAEDPSWPLSDFLFWLLIGTSLLSQLLHCSHCALLLLIEESGLGKGFLKPAISISPLTNSEREPFSSGVRLTRSVRRQRVCQLTDPDLPLSKARMR